MAIGVLRHQGFIDFGGAKDQTGFDVDPDFMMISSDVRKLGSTWTPIGQGFWWAPAYTVEEYVAVQCDCPKSLLRFYSEIGVNLSEIYGGEIIHENFGKERTTMEISPCLESDRLRVAIVEKKREAMEVTRAARINRSPLSRA